jgi:D-3-phosphoglycerate dehydrogenase
MVRLALEGQFVPYAVNVSAGAEVSEAVRPFVHLAERLGSLLGGLAEGGVRSIVASYLGRIAEHDTRVLTLAALKGILERSVSEPVSFVNAPMLARERGLTVSEMRSTASEDFVSQVSLRAETGSEPAVVVAGTLLGRRNAERVIQVWDFEVEIEPSEHMLFLIYEDRPGIIGKVGTILGEHDINIATMEVGRKAAGGDALMGLTVDSPVPPEVLASIADAIDAHTIRAVTMTP